MKASFKLISALLSVLATVGASPSLAPRQSIIPLTASQIASYKPYTYFASTAYCTPNTTVNWTCGRMCDANPGFVPQASGGDGSSIQYWFVGYAPAQNTVVVSHQGTDTSKMQADLTDGAAVLGPLDPTLFPGVPSSVQVHQGFAAEQAKTATTILDAVQKSMSAHGATTVHVVGHSLGAALALLDGVYLPLHLPSGTTVTVVGYGEPRVGNSAFANWVDGHIAVTRINNREDYIPIMPGQSMGYSHPSGEVHIQDSGVWVSCPGQENPSTQCTDGDVPTIAQGNQTDHSGPYDGIVMGC
ncbi:putative alpha beta-hydrolase [Lyophyllum shimeji]|uniref:Alpha beta-hydrolase n=1 Tax=Lyophyllum shimeji TaxID=47721 RepID=A0A9P3PZI8_LYOSH|nr:putative alpha beta-hydrolase [Lyophyllum shimeji]